MAATHRALGLPSPFFRHALVLALGIAAVLVPSLVLAMPIAASVGLWLTLAAGAGLVGAVLGRGWLGVLFVLLGMGAGVLLMLAVQHGAANSAASHLASHSGAYLAVAAVAAAAYAGTAVLISLVSRNRARR